MRFVAVKSVAQQDAQAAHRIREELVGQRTAKANQIRGLVGEYGIVAPIGIQQLRRALSIWLEDAENGLTDAFRTLLADLATCRIGGSELLKNFSDSDPLIVCGDRCA